jgi:putative exporter of polyketide antibiotics
MLGALIPDIVKIAIPLSFFGFYIYYLIAAIHTPAGSTVVAAIISMFFKEKKLIFGLLILGVGTHYLIDLLLNDIGANIYLFYPLSWSSWQIGIFSNTDYLITIISIVVAIIVYLISINIDKNLELINNKI